MSDSHGQHQGVNIPDGDMLIHAGDVSDVGKKEQVTEFIEWFTRQPHKYKIFIAGNHDFYLEQAPHHELSALIPDNLIYLNDESIIIEGIKIFGSPVTPWFDNWAFNRFPGNDIQKHWDKIPADVDILLTHGPPWKIMDQVKAGPHTGSEDLLKTINEIKPPYHFFGHIHEEYGTWSNGHTRFYNACVLNSDYQLQNEPFVIELKK